MGRNLWKILLLLSVLCIFTGCSSSKGQDSKNEHNIKDEDEKEAFYQGEIMALKHAEYSECMCSRDGIVYTVASRYQEDGSYENQLSVIEVQGKETLYEMPFLTDEVEAVTVLDNGDICLLARSNRSMPSRIITVNEVGESRERKKFITKKNLMLLFFSRMELPLWQQRELSYCMIGKGRKRPVLTVGWNSVFLFLL